MLFSDWSTIGRTVLVGLLAYVLLVLLLRVSGKRALSKWNAFDLVVTVALGSSLATILLSKTTTLAQGATGFALLILAQFLVTWLSVRSGCFERLIKQKPVLLLSDGEILEDALRRERVAESEVRAALRGQGIGSVEEVAAVVLETNGSFSVIKKLDGSSASAMADVTGFEDR